MDNQQEKKSFKEKITNTALENGIFGELITTLGSVRTKRRLSLVVYLQFMLMAVSLQIYLGVGAGSLSVILGFFIITTTIYSLSFIIEGLKDTTVGLISTISFVMIFSYGLAYGDNPLFILFAAFSIVAWAFLTHGPKLGILFYGSIMVVVSILVAIDSVDLFENDMSMNWIIGGAVFNIFVVAVSLFLIEYVVLSSSHEILERSVDADDALNRIDFVAKDSPTATIVTDAESTIQYISPAALEMVGLKKTDVLYQPIGGSIFFADKDGKFLPSQNHPIQLILDGSEALKFDGDLIVLTNKKNDLRLTGTVRPLMSNKELRGAVLEFLPAADQSDVNVSKTQDPEATEEEASKE